MLQPEVFCEDHAAQYPCRSCGRGDVPVVSLGDEHGYEFCADCLRRFLGLLNQFLVHGRVCDLCFVGFMEQAATAGDDRPEGEATP